MLGFLNSPEMPSALPALMAIAILTWVIFLVYFAYTSRTAGPIAAFNRVATFLITLALGFTFVTSMVWNWGVRQATSRISTSAGWDLLDSASGGVTQLGQAAEANRVSILDTAPEFAGAATASNPQSGGGQQQVVADPTPQPAVQVQTVPQPLDFEFGQKTLKGVGEIHAWRAKVEGDLWIYNQLVLMDGSTVTAPKDLPAKIPLPPTPIPATTLVVQTPPPEPTLQTAPQLETVVTMTPEQIMQQQALCWLNWAEINDFSSYTGSDGESLIPFGVSAQLYGPGDWQTFWKTAGSEVWRLEIPSFGIQNYPVTGTWARSVANADDSGETIFQGRGLFCQP